MVSDTITLEGHLIDSDIMRRVFDRVVEEGGEFEVQEFRVGRTNDEASFARVEVRARDPHGSTASWRRCATSAPPARWRTAASGPPSRTASCRRLLLDHELRHARAHRRALVEAVHQKMDAALVLRDGCRTA